MTLKVETHERDESTIVCGYDTLESENYPLIEIVIFEDGRIKCNVSSALPRDEPGRLLNLYHMVYLKVRYTMEEEIFV